MKIASVRVEAEDLLAPESSNGHIHGLPAALKIATVTVPDWSRDMLAPIEARTEDRAINLPLKAPEVLEFSSGYMTLLPGDINSMGTALKHAKGTGRAVQNVDLRVLGGSASVSIETIGTLSNSVETAP